MKYDVTFTRIGSAVIEANSETRALKIAQNYGECQVLWGDYEATDANLLEDDFAGDEVEEPCQSIQFLGDETDFDHVQNNDGSDCEQADEFTFMVDFAENHGFDEDICRDQFRMLWTSFCLHNDLDPDTARYDNNLRKLWAVVELEGEYTADWSDLDSFGDFMCKYLV